jgi:hypothetical protein
MKIKRYKSFFIVIANLGVLLTLFAYWWSADLIYFWISTKKSEDERMHVVRASIAFPIVRRRGLVEMAANRFLRGKAFYLIDILKGRYSDDILMDELESLFGQHLNARNYSQAGIILSFARHLYGDKFRSHVSRKQIETLIIGLGPNLYSYLSHYWRYESTVDELIARDTPFEQAIRDRKRIVTDQGLVSLRGYARVE